MAQAEEVDAQLEELLEYVKRARGFDFTGYKRASLRRRILKRMQAAEIEGFDNYTAHLEAEPDEFAALFDTILINVTSFFRDPTSWAYVADEILPQIIADKPRAAPIRVWSAGCSSGQEAYTISILLARALGEQDFRERVKVYATDIDEDALAQGRHGAYGAKAMESMPPDLRARYFEVRNDHSVFRPDLRGSIIFGRHDLVQDPPISKIDFLVSRNTLMYFNAETQNRILANYSFALNDNGYLFLGKSEVLLSRTNMFLPVDLKRRVFAKVPGFRHRDARGLDRALRAGSGGEEGAEIGEVAYEAGSLAQILVSIDGTLLLANREARALFGLTLQDLGRPLQDLEISYRPVEIRSKIEQVIAQRNEVSVQGVEWRTNTGERRIIEVKVAPVVGSTGRLEAVNIAFVDATAHWTVTQDLEESKRELETAYDELHSTVEELETTNEELQSTNEELETTNEELQSTNEELETMNEELQSTNEEMETTNDELQERTEALNQVNFFLESVLTSLRAAAVVLDRELRVQTWNAHAEELWGLRLDEVVGSNFLNLEIGLPVDRLRQSIRRCLSGQSSSDEMTLDATNRRGKSIGCKVAVSPLLTGPSEIGGVILLMEDVS